MYDLMRDVVVVTNRRLCVRPFAEQMERVCRLHPAAVIIREKDLDERAYGAAADEIRALCERYQVPCVYHTHAEAAQRAGVRRIHLPLHRLMALAESSALGGFETVGVSVHSVEEALTAARLGATCLTAGHIYATDCKKGLPPRGTEFLRQVCRAVELPVYAIGGIRPDRRQLAEVKECGAAGACVMSAMMRV